MAVPKVSLIPQVKSSVDNSTYSLIKATLVTVKCVTDLTPIFWWWLSWSMFFLRSSSVVMPSSTSFLAAAGLQWGGITLSSTWIYSGTSDKGPSEKGTTSQQRTTSGPLSHSISSFLTSEKRTTSQRRTKWPVPKCPLFGGSTVECTCA